MIAGESHLFLLSMKRTDQLYLKKAATLFLGGFGPYQIIRGRFSWREYSTRKSDVIWD